MAATDTSKLKFSISARTLRYGDRRSFIEYRVIMSDGRGVAGIERGPTRTFTERGEALKAARKRVRELRTRRLFVIRVTRKHIRDGEGRNCQTCAIAQALWHNQERMGLPKREFYFEVSPYACFADPEGIVLSRRFSSEPDLVIEADALPDMALEVRGKVYHEGLGEWAMRFDDYDDSRHMSLAEWREKNGYESDERPYSPGPVSFVLDLDAFKAEQEEAA